VRFGRDGGSKWVYVNRVARPVVRDRPVTDFGLNRTQAQTQPPTHPQAHNQAQPDRIQDSGPSRDLSWTAGS